MSETARKRTLLAVVVGLVLLAGAGATAFVVTRGDEADARPLAPPTTTSTSTTTTSTTTTTVPIPVPDPPPGDPYAQVPVFQLGTIAIPKINLVHPIFEGVWLTVVDHGPGHWPNSALPGKVGNTVFAGHRVTHTHPFFDLDLLAPGDQVIFDMSDGVFTYEVTSITIVQPSDLSITASTRQKTFTLFACNPKHSAAERIVAKGKLVESVLKKKAKA